MAVRLSWLEEVFCKQLRADIATFEIVTEIVIPETKAHGCRCEGILFFSNIRPGT